MTADAEVVLITGASSGIGAATAVAYAERGAHVVLIARGRELLDAATDACRGAGAASATAVVADVLDADAIERACTETSARLGRIDVVVHAAMVMAYGNIEELPPETYRRVVDTAVHGTAHLAWAALPIFRSQERGTLVIVTSLLASVAVPGIGAYVTAKWGQAGLARVLQLETADAPDIHVATVAPGAVDTPIYQRAANVGGRPGKPPPPVDAAEKVAAAIVRAAEGHRRHISVGPLNGLVIFGARFATPLYDRLVGPLYRRFALGGDPVEATDGNVFTFSSPGMEPPPRIDGTAASTSSPA
ncbi:MAG: short-chain dehydrogenase/reductase [Acidimicrobiales bacterium]|nr:short-chain dehydrogenase/reductase [Acidimicrobiales bacterium]